MALQIPGRHNYKFDLKAKSNTIFLTNMIGIDNPKITEERLQWELRMLEQWNEDIDSLCVKECKNCVKGI